MLLGDEAMCPLATKRTDLCNAALSSQMINMTNCRDEAYLKCPIYAIQAQWSIDNDRRMLLQKSGEEKKNLVGTGHVTLPEE